MPSRSDVRIQAMPKGPGEGMCDSSVRRCHFNEISKDPINRTEKTDESQKKKIQVNICTLCVLTSSVDIQTISNDSII